METRPEEHLPDQPDAQWVSLWLDGELSPEQEQRLQQALQQDAQLAQLARQWKQLRDQLRGLPRRELGAEFTQGVMQRIAALGAPGSSPAEEGGKQSASVPETAEPEKSAESPRPAAAAFDSARRRFPWEFWACWGTAVAVASLLVVWVWQAWQPQQQVVMDHVAAPEAAPSAPEVAEEALDSADRVRSGEPEAAAGLPKGSDLPPQANARLAAKGAGQGKVATLRKASPGRRGKRSRDEAMPQADRMPRALGPGAGRPAARALGGASLSVRQSQEVQAAPGQQVIPWNRLPGYLQNALVQSQQTLPSSQVVVVQLGVTREALRRGWLRAQLASVSPEQRELQRRTSKRLRRSALAESAPAVEPKVAAALRDDARDIKQDKPARTTSEKEGQVVRVRVSPEQLPQLLDRLSQAQAAGGPVQYLNVGQLADVAPIPVPEAGQFGFSGNAAGAGFSSRAALPRKQQGLVSQQLILQPLPQRHLFSQQQAPGAALPLQNAEKERPRPAAPLQSGADAVKQKFDSPQQPVVQLWLVVELEPPAKSPLPLVAPEPQKGSR